MIFRCTTKLAKKIGAYQNSSNIEAENSFLDWHVNLFTCQRIQYIIVTNTTSLLSVFMYGRGITDETDFIRGFVNIAKNYLPEIGCEFQLLKFIAPKTSVVTFTKTNSRSVLGSMNDFVNIAKWLITEKECSPYDLSFEINRTPMSYLKMDSPYNVLKKMTPRE